MKRELELEELEVVTESALDVVLMATQAQEKGLSPGLVALIETEPVVLTLEDQMKQLMVEYHRLKELHTPEAYAIQNKFMRLQREAQLSGCGWELGCSSCMRQRGLRV